MWNKHWRSSPKSDAGGWRRYSGGEEMGTTVTEHLLPKSSYQCHTERCCRRTEFCCRIISVYSYEKEETLVMMMMVYTRKAEKSRKRVTFTTKESHINSGNMKRAYSISDWKKIKPLKHEIKRYQYDIIISPPHGAEALSDDACLTSV